MYKGTVTFSARIKGNGLTFSLVEYNPQEPGVDKVEIEGRNGDRNGNEILSTVHLASVATREAGKALATKVNAAALNRISFLHSIAIEHHTITGGQLVLVNPPPGTVELEGIALHITEGVVGLVRGVPAETIKAELEQPSLPGEHYYGLLRSARQSMSPVEEFVHVYNLLLMLCSNDDHFPDVETFIRIKEPTVLQTPVPPRSMPRPKMRPEVTETVYTRLRHQLSHSRTLGDLDRTKAEIVQHLGGLIALTKQAIENP